MAKVNLFKGIRYGLEGYFDFKSRSTRPEYWYWTLFTTLGLLALVLLTPLGIFFCVAIAIPSSAVSVRRLHDIDRTGWWMLLVLIPVIGSIILILFFAIEGQKAVIGSGARKKKQDAAPALAWRP